jgi:hypothetical protein
MRIDATSERITPYTDLTCCNYFVLLKMAATPYKRSFSLKNMRETDADPSFSQPIKLTRYKIILPSNPTAGDSGMPFAQHKGEDRASEGSAKGGLP